MKPIEIANLSFRYRKNEKLVLKDLSFACEKGSVNVLIGLNGSGKTTLIKLIAGLLNGYDGNILLNGNNLKTLSVKKRSQIISYVAQRSSAIDDFSVIEYLSFAKANRMRFYQSPTTADTKQIADICEQMNISYLSEQKLGEISGGERQIVAICGAIIQDTELIVLDEPTSALDIKNQNMILSFIKDIAKKQNKTVILSSHNPNHALFLDANVLLLQDGNILEQGNAKEIITVEKLQHIYGDKIVYSKDLGYDEISFCDISDKTKTP